MTVASRRGLSDRVVARRVAPFLPVSFAGFALFGLVIGAQGVVWAELMPALALAPGVFGSAQLVGPLVSIGLLLGAGPWVGRRGKQTTALLGLAFLAASLAGLAAAGGLRGLVAALAVQGAGVGLLELGLNGAVLDWEGSGGRRVMSVMHAACSGAAVVGALAAGALLERGWRYAAVLALLAVGSVSVGAMVRVAHYPPASAQAGRPARSLAALARRPGLVALAAVAVLAIVGESVANTWSVIYLSERGASLLVGGAAFALFNGAMAIGRLVNAPLATAIGPRGSLLASGAGLVLAGLALVAGDAVAVAVTGFVLLGLAVGGIVPTVLSAAGEAVPGDTGRVTGGILAVAYAGFVVTPPLVGWVAELVSLRGAMTSVMLVGLGVAWLAREIPSR
jgi:MFS family permease